MAWLRLPQITYDNAIEGPGAFQWWTADGIRAAEHDALGVAFSDETLSRLDNLEAEEEARLDVMLIAEDAARRKADYEAFIRAQDKAEAFARDWNEAERRMRSDD